MDKNKKTKNKTLTDFCISNSDEYFLLKLYHTMNKKSITNPKFDNDLEKKIRKFKIFFIRDNLCPCVLLYCEYKYLIGK